MRLIALLLLTLVIAGCTGNRVADLAGSVVFHSVVWH